MKRGYRAGIILGMILLFSVGLSVNVRADEYVEETVLTEEERYDPRYYKPISESTADTGRSRSRARAAKASFEDKVIASLLELEPSIDVSEYQMPVEDFKTAYYQMLHDHAELFFVKAGYSGSSMGGKMMKFNPIYIQGMTDKQKVREAVQKIENVVNEALSLVTDDMEDYEKALVIHDWMAKHCEYDYDNYLNGRIPDESYTVYGTFVNKKAVCQGYAEAYAYIMQQKLGIPCGIVSSDSMNHAWNMIRLGDHYYHVDVTWDDPTWDCIGRARHAYFLMSDNTFQTASESAGRTPHTGWVSDVKAEDTAYEAGLWANSDSGVIESNGTWYYIDNAEKKLKKTDNILNGTVKDCYTFGTWYTPDNKYYSVSFSYLWRYRNKLLFNDAKEIYSMSLTTGEVASIYTPANIPSGSNIYGFKLDGDTMKYAVQTSPNIKQSQAEFITTVSIPGQKLTGVLEIEGKQSYGSILTAKVTLGAGLTGVVRYQWYSDGQLLPGAVSDQYELTASDVGKVITVKAIHDDYIGELEQSTVAIQKAVPGQPAPIKGLKGNYGETLSAVQLPEGYVWKNPDTVMNQPGSQNYTVIYTPDETIYESIEFELSIEVSSRPACTVHIWDQGVQTAEPTCTEPGVMTYNCQNCDTIKTEVIPATGHQNTEKQNEKAATCKEEGYSGDVYCRDCKTVIETGSIIAATGIHIWDAGEITEIATCTEAGVMTYTCQNCNTVKTEVIQATGHQNTEKQNEKAATCKEEGYSGDVYCRDCKTVIETGSIIAATGIHIWDAGEITEEATCTETGVMTYNCQNCDTVKKEVIPATGHQNTEKQNEKAATCKEEGYSGDVYCRDCKTVIETGSIIAATGIHIWDAGEITKAATCTTAGMRVLTCTSCGETASGEIPPTGHIHTEKRNEKAAACTQAGYSGDIYCTDCGTKLENGTAISATGHQHTEVRNQRNATITETGYTGDTYCKDCGTKLASGMEIAITVRVPKKGTVLKSGKFYYQVTKSGVKNGTVAFYKVSGTVKKLTLPASVTIDGITYKVTSMAPKALRNNKKITQITLGSNLTSIGKEAFAGCKNLKKIIIKSNALKSIGKNAIKNIHKKATIKCPPKKVKAYKKLFTAKTGYKKKTMKIAK